MMILEKKRTVPTPPRQSDIAQSIVHHTRPEHLGVSKGIHLVDTKKVFRPGAVSQRFGGMRVARAWGNRPLLIEGHRLLHLTERAPRM